MENQLFCTNSGRDLRWEHFLTTDLGQLYQAIPFERLCHLFPARSGKGRPPILGLQGGIALQFLKAYLGLSDEKIVERLNTDWAIQYFCGISLGAGERIKDKDLVGRWRRYLSRQINYESFQAVLASHWSDHINDKHAVLMDATCYESHLRYPTDVKLLWESCEWLWQFIDEQYKKLRLPKARRKQLEVQKAFINYQKLRRKTRRKEHKLRRRLLYFLNKGLDTYDRLVFDHRIVHRQRDYERLQTIKQVYLQQQLHFNDPSAGIKDRIVSLAKPYIRPIVRGKETKTVEFGAKVHVWQVDGISFVDCVRFDAFNELTRLPHVLDVHQSYFGKVRQLGADKIYATNANRKQCTRLGIATSFVRKGPKPKEPTNSDKMRVLLSKARSSRMEGAFGNEKQHYTLGRIRARTMLTETFWIHIGIWTASAVIIGKRMQQAAVNKLAA